MARKQVNLRRFPKYFSLFLYRILGLKKRADLQYVRLLEGYLLHQEIQMLYETVGRLDGPGEIAEIGSWKGKSTVALGLALQRSKKNKKIYAIDHHQGSEEHTEIISTEGSTWDTFLDTIKSAGVDSLIHPLKMDSLSAAKWMEENHVKLQFLFIDGAHDEESVTQDIKAFLPVMNPGGYIAFHDAKPEGRFPGVYKAYEKFVKDKSREIGWAKSLFLVQLKKEGE